MNLEVWERKAGRTVKRQLHGAQWWSKGKRSSHREGPEYWGALRDKTEWQIRWVGRMPKLMSRFLTYINRGMAEYNQSMKGWRRIILTDYLLCIYSISQLAGLQIAQNFRNHLLKLVVSLIFFLYLLKWWNSIFLIHKSLHFTRPKRKLRPLLGLKISATWNGVICRCF